MSHTNRQIVLAARPVGMPVVSDFRIETTQTREVQAGEVLIEVLYLSVDPYMRGRISGAKSYAKPVEIGELMVGGGVGRVLESQHDAYHPGDIAAGFFGWQEYAVVKGDQLRKVDPTLAPISTSLGVLGMTGLTAYFGLIDICHPKPGETVVVSGAAGAVGSMVGQIAKIKGCKVIGIAGSDDKIHHLTQELGFDAAFNYKTVTNYYDKLHELCPGGIDIYFDNVGGEITDAVIRLLNVHARITVCGQISQYNLEKPEVGPRWLTQLIITRSKVQGMLVGDYAPRFAEGLSHLSEWLKEGKLQYREDVVYGLENAPAAFIGMLQGKNLGKQLVKIKG